MPKRIDRNQNEIVKTFRQLGILVYITSNLGNGFPDLVILFKNRIWLIEIKNGKLAKSAQKLTEKEDKFHTLWKDHVVIITSIQDVIDFVNKK